MASTFDLAKVFASLADAYLNRERAARKGLAEAMMDIDRAIDTSLIREAMLASAKALPYREVMEGAEAAGMREALSDVRNRLTRQLLSRAMGSSTCPIANAAALMEVEAAQSFLASTEGLLEYAKAAAAEPAPEPEPQPAPASAPIDVPKVTAPQRRALEAIRDNGVRLQEFRAGTLMVNVERGSKPRRDMIEWVIEQGWAARDTSRSLFMGQPVTLTKTGEAILAS